MSTRQHEKNKRKHQQRQQRLAQDLQRLDHDRHRLDERKKLPGYPMPMGGQVFYLLPPGREGIRKMEEFVLANRRSPLDIAKSKLDGLTPDQQKDLLRDALARESSMANAISEADFAAALDTREGAAMMFWLMVRKNHPELSQEQVEATLEQATDEEFQKFLVDRDAMIGKEG